MDQEKIGKFIQNVRKEKGLTQSELGNRLGVSYKAVSKWETGMSFPDASLLKPLCYELGITIDELLNGEENNDKSGIVFDYLNFQQKKYKNKFLIIIVIVFLIITSLILGLYFINNYNKIKIYKLYGESEHFKYINGGFISSSSTYYLFYGNFLKKDDNVELQYYEIKNGEEYIAGGGGSLFRIINENYGYGESNDKEIINNIDKWQIIVHYTINEFEQTEVIKLKNDILYESTRFFPKKVDSVIETWTTPEQKEALKEYNLYNEKKNELKVKLRSFLQSNDYQQEQIFHPITNKPLENSDIQIYTKKNNDGSLWNVQIGTTILINYIKDNLKVIHNPISNVFFFQGEYKKEKFSYTFNPYRKVNKCETDNCPEDFLHTASNFNDLYNNEFGDIEDFVENEFWDDEKDFLFGNIIEDY